MNLHALLGALVEDLSMKFAEGLVMNQSVQLLIKQNSQNSLIQQRTKASVSES